METGSKIQDCGWKTKAKARSLANKCLRKELVRQKGRAEFWRSVSFSQKRQLAEQGATIAALTLRINELEACRVVNSVGNKVSSVSVKGYKFLLSVMWLSVCLYKSGLSFRCVCSVLGFIKTFTGLNFAVPSYGTVRVWVQKMGLHLLKNGGKIVSRGVEKREKWCLIVDESYSLGKSQLLLILGVRLSRLQMNQPLRCTDVVPLVIKSQPTWKGEEIAVVLQEVVKKVTGDIVYGVADRGKNIVSGFQIAGIPHISDWAHFSANILEKCYVDDADFKTFNEKMGAFKKKRKQSQYTDYSPPKLSVKVRFMNYTPFLEWAKIMLLNFEQIPPEIAPELAFLKELKPFIEQMTALFEMRNKIGCLLRNEGIQPKTQTKALDLLAILEKNRTTKHPQSPKVTAFIIGTKQYFDRAMPIYTEIYKQRDAQKPEKNNVAPIFEGLVASSEIIESIFGKLKHRSPKDPKRGFTAFTLIITLFCTDFSIKDTYKALSSVSMKELEKWKIKNLTLRHYTSFRNVFHNKSKKGKQKKQAV